MQLSKKMANLERQVRRVEYMKVLHTRNSMLQELVVLGGRLKFASLTDLGIGAGIDAWLEYARTASDEDLAVAIAHGYYQADSLAMAAIEASDVDRKRVKELSAESHALRRELDRHAPPPRTLLECTVRRWATKASSPHDDLKPDRIDTFLREASERRLLMHIERAESIYFIGKHRHRRIEVIRQHLDEIKPYCGDPALAVAKMDEKGYATFANGQIRLMTTDDVEQFWAEIVGKHGQQTVGGNPKIAPIQQYLCQHPGESIPFWDNNRKYELILMDDDALAVTKKLNARKLYTEDDIEQLLQWVNRDTKSESQLVDPERIL